MKILVTGGAGFIGSAVIRHLLTATGHGVVNLDALTYAGNLASLATVVPNERYVFEHVDVRDRPALDRVFATHRPDAVMHLAAESHVDRSIVGARDFIETNITGTFVLLEAARAWYASGACPQFRFHHVSTDEVFGDLEPHAAPFTETSPYAPSSPYAASKAASDHLVRSWGRTYGLPIVLSNCSNNYGPYQFPEKLIPLMILNAVAGKALPIYGDGTQVRDWLYVDDHARALLAVLEHGVCGHTYLIGGHNEQRNIDVVQRICDLLDERLPLPKGLSARRDLVRHVRDRPGHDTRYAIDASLIERELGWAPDETFDTGLAKTVDWYLANGDWVADVQSGAYRDWIADHYKDTP